MFFMPKSYKREKARNVQQNLAKNSFFKFAPKHWWSVLFQKTHFDPFGVRSTQTLVEIFNKPDTSGN